MSASVVSSTPNEDGTVTTSVTHEVGAVAGLNFAALIQAIIAAAPSLLAILQALTASKAPVDPAPLAPVLHAEEK